MGDEPLTLNETQRATLRAVCDTIVPRLDVADDPHGAFATSATDLGVDAVLEMLIASFPEEQAVGLFFLLEVLGAQGFAEASQEERERREAEEQARREAEEAAAAEAAEQGAATPAENGEASPAETPSPTAAEGGEGGAA